MRYCLYLLIICLTFGSFIQNSAAGRFGGGRGFGMMHSRPSFSNSYRTNQKTTTHRTYANKSPLRNIFTGMLLGGLITSLFMGNGLGSTLMSWLFVALMVALVIRFLERRKLTNKNRPQ